MTREEAWAWFTVGATRYQHASNPAETLAEARAAFDRLYDAAVAAIPAPAPDPSRVRTFAELGRCAVCVGPLPCAKHPASATGEPRECGAISGDRRGVRCAEPVGHDGPHVTARGTRFMSAYRPTIPAPEPGTIKNTFVFRDPAAAYCPDDYTEEWAALNGLALTCERCGLPFDRTGRTRYTSPELASEAHRDLAPVLCPRFLGREEVWTCEGVRLEPTTAPNKPDGSSR